ncbi:MAG: hypothetical protein DRR16_28290 [Candidatus Parabeggiatoa sp. nov. 3]|jgi:hypothetical protein|nr:MAG: hypothetical protein DRR00_30255 [Gammaproteobacteria bacterium]RKZ59108.1 MAG: hypothetical protein DRQ99_24330 [Gammaproteobacteria bacterium]RKZ78137.1 MAG: hypothetical protein DRR16_28290 [Gammaproteobacteria bacterium]
MNEIKKAIERAIETNNEEFVDLLADIQFEVAGMLVESAKSDLEKAKSYLPSSHNMSIIEKALATLDNY